MWQPKRPSIRPKPSAVRVQQSALTQFPITMLLRRLGLLAIVVVLGYGCYWVFAKWLIVRNITCFSRDQRLADEECAAAAALMGRSMLFTRFDDASLVMEMQKVSTQNQLLYYTHLRKRLPNRLELHYAVSQPAYLVSADQTTWAAVNDRGALKVMEDPGSLPKVFVSAAWGEYMANGQVTDLSTHHWIIQVLFQAAQQNRPIAYMGLDDRQQVSIVFQDGRRILITGTADPVVELYRLKLIEQESAQNERFTTTKIKEIDLRFKFPVIRT